MSLLDNNFETEYPVDYWFTVDYKEKIVKEIRKNKDGYNEYLLNDGVWVTGKYITCYSD